MAIFEKTIQNKKFDQLLWKLEKQETFAGTRHIMNGRNIRRIYGNQYRNRRGTRRI